MKDKDFVAETVKAKFELDPMSPDAAVGDTTLVERGVGLELRRHPTVKFQSLFCYAAMNRLYLRHPLDCTHARHKLRGRPPLPWQRKARASLFVSVSTAQSGLKVIVEDCRWRSSILDYYGCTDISTNG